jgi:outer membrane protein assembly factor BamB
LRKSPAVFLLLLSVSCSLFRPKVSPYPTGVVFPLAEAGRVEFEGRAIRNLEKGEDGRLYFSTDTGHLYCLDTAGKEISWQYAGQAPFGCPPALGPERLFVWDQANFVSCFDRQGNPGWRAKLPDTISSPISADRERVYLGTEPGVLVALSQATGETVWEFQAKAPLTAAPVFFGESIVVGCGDGRVHLLSVRGERQAGLDLGSPVRVTPLVDGDVLFVGTEDSAFHCYSLRNMRRKWTVKAAGRLLSAPRTDEKNAYFQASNSVLYALDKRNGHIRWWWIAPSPSPYDLEFVGQTVLATSRSPLLFSLDRKSGKAAGKYEARTEIRSNPVWVDPNVAFATFDVAAGRGIVAFLRKQVKVELASSLKSPQPAGTEVSFTASATGFYLPRYEFYLRQGEERTVVQKASEKNSWVWFAEKEGAYFVGVRVSDEKQLEEAELSFEVSKKEDKIKSEKEKKGG